jgi:hypothetical protein
MDEDLDKKAWWNYIHEDIRELLTQTLLLLKTADKWESRVSETLGRGSIKKNTFHDYSFIVFPAAKAYEGFLKNLFFDLGFISHDDFYGKRFRIGKALNPALEKEYREKEGVYDKLVNFCGGKELADDLWNTWRQCRNVLFHWFPNEKNAINLEEAKNRAMMVIASIDLAFEECKVRKRNNFK